VFFTPDDDFHDRDDTWDLPDSAVALLARAGSWSARNHRNGFVPSSQLARFSSDPQAVRELIRRAIFRKVKGGCQFTDWARWGELAEEIERKRNDAAERQRRHRAKKKEADQKEKPQVSVGDVTHLSRVTTCDRPRSDQDQDLDHLSRITGQPNVRVPEHPALAAAVASALTGKSGRLVTDTEAADVMRKIRDRATRAGKPIRSPLRYMLRSIENEPDLYVDLLLDAPPPLTAVLAEQPHVPDAHPYRHNPATAACADCEFPKAHVKHREAS
jgi:hypothetical protein